MVSRRNFFSITIMMLTLLFIFMATQFSHDYLTENRQNEFILEDVISGADEWQPEELDISDPYLDAQYILFLGDGDGTLGHTVRQWCQYSKRNLIVCENLSDFAGSIGKNQEYLLIESAQLNIREDLKTLNKFAEAGVKIVFCDLPQTQEIRRSAPLRQLLGIREIREEAVTAEGIKLFSGFLLGGEVSYGEKDGLQPEDLEMPWYQLGGGTRTYMVGLLDEQRVTEEEITPEALPAVMWSHSDGNCQVFAVNGDYLHDNGGIGILSAIDAALNEYALYPIVDAQLLTVANYPGLANENAEFMDRTFNNGIIQIGRDLVYPQLVATASQTGFTMSCMLQPQYDYQDANLPQAGAFHDYTKLIIKARAEMGLSLDRSGGISLAEKLEEDCRFLEKADSQYAFGAVYTGHDPYETVAAEASVPDSVRTIVSAQDPAQDIIAFANDDITVQTITSDASTHSFRSDLQMRSVQTALGYSNVLLDMNRVFHPGENEESWESLSKSYAENLYSGWYNFQAFEDVTVSAADQKIRQLLVMDYEQVRKDKTIYLELDSVVQEVSFILRLQNAKPGYVSSGSCTELETGVYLLRITEPSVEIHLVSSNPIQG